MILFSFKYYIEKKYAAVCQFLGMKVVEYLFEKSKLIYNEIKIYFLFTNHTLLRGLV